MKIAKTKLSDEILAEAYEWFNSKDVKEAINSTLRSLNQVCINMEKLDYSTLRPDVASKVAMNLTKSIDELTRLMALVQGDPDQRTEVVGLADLLKVLTNEQSEQVRKWLAESREQKFDS